MATAYKIAENLVVRDGDSALFDSVNFRILKFNDTGFNLLKALRNGQLSSEDYEAYASQHDVSKEDLNEFVNKCIEHGIILQEEK